MDELDQNVREPEEQPAEQPLQDTDVPAEADAEEMDAVSAEETDAASTDFDDETAEPKTMEDALVQELEGIRDMLQQELDKGGEEPLIQELDETAAEEEIPEEDRCQCCGEKKRDTSRGEDYPYCADCRAVMKAAPLRVPAVLLLLLTFILAGASLYFTSLYLEDYSLLLEGETHYEARELSDAMESFYSYFSKKQGADLLGPTDFADAYSITAAKHLTDCFVQMGYLSNANDIVTTFLGEKALQRPWNKKYLAMTQDFENLQTTSSAITALMQDVLYYGVTDIDYKERDEQLQALLTEQDEDGNPKYNAAFVEFYRYVLLDLQKAKPEEMLKQLQTVQQLDGNEHEWLYLPTMADLAAKAGDEALTKQYADACLAINKQDTYAYRAMANVYRFQKEPDTEKMLAVAEEAQNQLTDANSVEPVYYEIEAVAYLLQGDYKQAMQAMEAYMNKPVSNGMPAYSVSACNLYALCSVLCDSQEGYDEMASVFASAGKEPSALIKQYQEGKITLIELLQNDGGEF